jgi:uncharacterized protein YggT (Ycf19 family)
MSGRYDEEYSRREGSPPAPGSPSPGPYSDPNRPGYVGPGAVPSSSYESRRSYSEVAVAPYNVRLVRTIWFIVGLIDALLLIRFVLRLLGASVSASFVQFMYGITDPLIAPFRGIFHTSGSGSYVFEPESLVAIIVYTLIGWGLVTLVRIITAPRRT